MSGVVEGCSDESINSKEYNSFETAISLTEYRYLINRQTCSFFKYNRLWGQMIMVNLVTCLFHFFETFNDAFEV